MLFIRHSIQNAIRRQKPKQSIIAIRWHGGPKVEANAPTVQITFMNPHPAAARMKEKSDHYSDIVGSDSQMIVDARIGETLLQTAHRHDIDLEGACEGGMVLVIKLFIIV